MKTRSMTTPVSPSRFERRGYSTWSGSRYWTAEADRLRGGGGGAGGATGAAATTGVGSGGVGSGGGATTNERSGLRRRRWRRHLRRLRRSDQADEHRRRVGDGLADLANLQQCPQCC